MKTEHETGDVVAYGPWIEYPAKKPVEPFGIAVTLGPPFLQPHQVQCGSGRPRFAWFDESIQYWREEDGGESPAIIHGVSRWREPVIEGGSQAERGAAAIQRAGLPAPPGVVLKVQAKLMQQRPDWFALCRVGWAVGRSQERWYFFDGNSWKEAPLGP